MKIRGARKILADQFRTDDRAILLNQASIGLKRKYCLPDSKHEQRIGNSRENQKQDHEGRGRGMISHELFSRGPQGDVSDSHFALRAWDKN